MKVNVEHVRKIREPICIGDVVIVKPLAQRDRYFMAIPAENRTDKPTPVCRLLDLEFMRVTTPITMDKGNTLAISDTVEMIESLISHDFDICDIVRKDEVSITLNRGISG